MPRLSKWSVEAWLLSDALAKELAKSGDVPVGIEKRETEMAIVNERTGKRPEIEDGMYTFKITETTQGVRQSDEYGHAGEPTITLKCLVLDVLDEDGEEIYLDPILSLKYKPAGKTQASNLYLYAVAAGVAPPPGSPFDTDLLIGRTLQGKITTEGDKWPKIEPKSLMPVKKANGQSAPSVAQEARAPWEGEAVDADTASAWWKARLGEGFERVKVIALCKEMFDGRIPGELNADELKGLTDQLNMSA